jgi:hypothetical protein
MNFGSVRLRAVTVKRSKVQVALDLDVREYRVVVKSRKIWVARGCSGYKTRPARILFRECAIVAVPIKSGETAPSRLGQKEKMAERPVLVGLVPQVVVLDEGDQVSWISDAGNLRVEFDVNRCPFSSNIFQAPAGMRLLSGPPRVGSKAATYKYRLWLNDQLVGQGEVILRGK